VLICVMVLQFALIRVDSNVIDVTLHVRGKVLLGVASAALIVAVGVLLVGPADLGIPGIVAALILGRAPLSVAYPMLLARLLELPKAITWLALVRPTLTSLVLFAAAAELRVHIGTRGWLLLVLLGSLTAVVAGGLAYAAGLTADQRSRVRLRVLKVVGRS
jgi:hypothetical protein